MMMKGHVGGQHWRCVRLPTTIDLEARDSPLALIMSRTGRTALEMMTD